MRSPFCNTFFFFFPLVVVNAATAPPEFKPATHNAGNGREIVKSSPRFQIYDVTPKQADDAIKLLESAYICLVDVLGWRSSGLSYRRDTSDDGPWYKMSAYGVPSPSSIGGAAGVMGSDAKTGTSFIKVIASSIGQPQVTVHEYGHALTYYERNWVDQGLTGTWWEPLANFIADLYITSPWCEPARKKYGVPNGRSNIVYEKIINDAHQVLVDGTDAQHGGKANYYQSWPFMSYLTYNPDNYTGLGKTAVRDMIRKYEVRSNKTPFHGLANVLGKGATVQQVVGRYWARMAYGDIGHPQSRQIFDAASPRLKFTTLESAGSGRYSVSAAKKPKYMGANIIRLKGTGKISVKVTADIPFTATLAIRTKGAAGAIRYVDLPAGAGEANVGASEEASLTVANTPAALVMYNGFEIWKTPGQGADKGLTYTLQLSGATA